MKYISIVYLLSIIQFLSVCSTEESPSSTYVEYSAPTTIWLTLSERISISEKIKLPSKIKAIHSVYQHALNALNNSPSPIETIIYEGHVSNHPDRIRSVIHLHDMEDIWALTWAYVFTGENRFVDKATEFILAWAKTYRPTGNDVNENKLNMCFWTYDVIKAKLSIENNEIIYNWLYKIGDLQRQYWSGNGSSNRHAKRLKLIQMASMALDQPEWKNFVLEKAYKTMNAALRPDGTTADLWKRDSMHYNCSCLTEIFKLAYLLRIDGTNLYTYKCKSGATLKKCLNFVLPYVKGEKIYKEWVNTKVDLDKKRWKSGDPFYRPGKPWDPSEAYELFVISSVFDPAFIYIAELLRKQNETIEISLAEVILSITK